MTMQEIHFFRAGEHTSSGGETLNFSAADLRAVAETYDASKHEAPLVIGHPKQDAPAYGWVDSVVFKDGGLYAKPRDVLPEFAEMVKQGAFKKVSAAFYPPRAKGNPTPGKLHLRHIGFLGAQPPSVKGLQPIEFADGGDTLEFDEGVFDLREQRLEFAERRIRTYGDRVMLDELAKSARIQFADVEPLLAFMEQLDDTTEIEFSEKVGNFSTPYAPASFEFAEEGAAPRMVSRPRREWFIDFLKRRLPQVRTGEMLKDGGDDDRSMEFSAPEGMKVDEAGSELRAAALAYAKDKGVSFAEAVKAVAPTTFEKGHL